MADSQCPRCQGRLLTLLAQGMVSLSTTSGEAATQSCTTDDDSFISLTCNTCELHLAVDPGDGRLRRADLYANPEESTAPLRLGDDSAADKETFERWEAQMQAIAMRMLGAVS